MVTFNPLESAAMICTLEDAVLQLNILSILDGDKGRSGATLRGRIKIMFERLIGRLLLSVDIGSLFEISLAEAFYENRDDMEGDSKDWQDATDAYRQLADKQADIEATKWKIAELQNAIPDLEEQNYFGECERKVACHIGHRWAESRLQLQQQTHCRREDETRRQIQDIRIQKRREYRVHSEIVRFLQLVTQDLKEQTESWQGKYNTYSAHWNTTLKTLQAEKEEHSTRLKVVAERLGRRMEFCAAVLATRERKRIEAETRQKRNEAVTRIQAWWRGHMIRRGFGAMKRRLKQKQQKLRASKT